ncbi:hypothetical protein BJ875DRAFT_523622 [Amylocarpus encephaloides]|uniref:Uncharacterized protein n=1 Tax=Amylocarpus encephaloides TaxID=45428 RepID=A0A9P7YA06_9HELO|nr:hypothetical protein BJ875DRAFT_523622 [Amylocarpus encephaloides]
MTNSIYWKHEEALYLWECMVSQQLGPELSSVKLKERFPNSSADFNRTSCKSKFQRLRYDKTFQQSLNGKDRFTSVSAAPAPHYPQTENTFTSSGQPENKPLVSQNFQSQPPPAASRQNLFRSTGVASSYFTQQTNNPLFVHSHTTIPQHTNGQQTYHSICEELHQNVGSSQVAKPFAPTFTTSEHALTLRERPIDHLSTAPASNIQGNYGKISNMPTADEMDIDSVESLGGFAYTAGPTPVDNAPIVTREDSGFATAPPDNKSFFGNPPIFSAMSQQPLVGISREQHLKDVDELDKILGVGAYQT